MNLKVLGIMWPSCMMMNLAYDYQMARCLAALHSRLPHAKYVIGSFEEHCERTEGGA